MDLSRRSDFDLKEMLKRPMDPAQKRAIQMELERRRAAPSNVRENLDGAATPLTPDPEVVDPGRRAYVETHIEDGWSPEQAEVLARGEANLPDAFNPARWNTDQARQNSRRAAVEQRQNEARADDFSRAQGEARGQFDPPAMVTWPDSTVKVDGLDVPVAMGGDGKPLLGPNGMPYYREGDRRRAVADNQRAMQKAGGDHGVPGPQRDDGMDPTPPPKFSSPEESRDYHTRYIDPKTGRLMPSKADRAMEARGYVAAYTPEGGISYMLAAPEDVVGERFSEHTPDGELSKKPWGPMDSEHVVTGMSPYSQRYAGYLSGVDQRDGGTVQPRFQPELVNTPFGSKYVMMPTDATRNANRQRDLDASIRRVAEATGVSMVPGRDPANGMTIEQLRAMKPEERARYYRDMKAEQQANNKARYRETAYRAGGSQNINGGNRAFWNTIGNMSPDDYQATMREMMPMDPRRAHVEAAHNEFDTQAQLRRQTGAGFQQPTPEQQRLLQVQVAQAEGQLPLEDRAASHTDKPEIHSDEVKMVDDYVASNFSANRPLWLGGGTTTSFTLAEQQRTVDWLVNDKGYTEEKARRIVDQIVENRYAKSWRGNWDE